VFPQRVGIDARIPSYGTLHRATLQLILSDCVYELASWQRDTARAGISRFRIRLKLLVMRLPDDRFKVDLAILRELAPNEKIL
jgi:hypothetical protein